MASVGEADSFKSGLSLFSKTFSAPAGLLGRRNLFALDTDGRVVATASLWEGDISACRCRASTG